MDNELDLIAKFAKKKNDAMNKIDGIVRTGKNKSQHYNYAEESEVVKVIRKVLYEEGISFAVSAHNFETTHDIATRSGSMKHITVSMVCIFTDTDTGYREILNWIGASADSGDKALYKAYSSGVKYFLMKNFLLPTGDDVESFKDVDEPPEPEKKNPEPKKEKDQPPTVTRKGTFYVNFQAQIIKEGVDVQAVHNQKEDFLFFNHVVTFMTSQRKLFFDTDNSDLKEWEILIAALPKENLSAAYSIFLTTLPIPPKE